MNKQTLITSSWPTGIESDAAGRLHVTLSDGGSIELEKFKDGCRERALELRQQAMVDAFEAASTALRRLSFAAVHFVRSRFARRVGARAHGT
jgi:hypothetical protein